MTIKELINKLKDYPQNMPIGIIGMPLDNIEFYIRHFEDEYGKIEEFDYLSLE